MSFLVNLRYQWAIDEGIVLGGENYSASGLDKNSFFRRDPIKNKSGIKLFDPQLYLIDLIPSESPNACARLSSYSWFPSECPTKGSDEGFREWMNRVKKSIKTNWETNLPNEPLEIHKAVKSCFEFQNRIDTDYLIIPTPLIKNPNTSLEYEMLWVDAGIKAYSEMGLEKPLLATLAISDICLKEDEPIENSFLEVCIDQLSSRPSLHGIYFVLERSTIGQKRLSQKNTAESILMLSYVFSQKINFKFIVNYCEEFGYISLGAGATHFSSDDTVKGRRLHLPDFIQRDGGSNYPYFYSLNNFSDFRPITDFKKLKKIGLFESLKIEETSFSKDLVEAIRRGDTSKVAEWQETLNNVAQAKNHYIESLNIATRKLLSSDIKSRMSQIRQELIEAEMRMNYISQRSLDEQIFESGSHISAWRSAFESFIENIKYL